MALKFVTHPVIFDVQTVLSYLVLALNLWIGLCPMKWSSGVWSVGDVSTNLGLKQDTTGLFVHQISQRCDLWCGRNRRLKFLVLIRNPARVPVRIRLPEPKATSDDDALTWMHLLCYWPFVIEIEQSAWSPPPPPPPPPKKKKKGQSGKAFRGWTSYWTNNRGADNLRCYETYLTPFYNFYETSFRRY